MFSICFFSFELLLSFFFCGPIALCFTTCTVFFQTLSPVYLSHQLQSQLIINFCYNNCFTLIQGTSNFVFHLFFVLEHSFLFSIDRYFQKVSRCNKYNDLVQKEWSRLQEVLIDNISIGHVETYEN